MLSGCNMMFYFSNFLFYLIFTLSCYLSWFWLSRLNFSLNSRLRLTLRRNLSRKSCPCFLWSVLRLPPIMLFRNLGLIVLNRNYIILLCDLNSLWLWLMGKRYNLRLLTTHEVANKDIIMKQQNESKYENNSNISSIQRKCWFKWIVYWDYTK